MVKLVDDLLRPFVVDRIASTRLVALQAFGRFKKEQSFGKNGEVELYMALKLTHLTMSWCACGTSAANRTGRLTQRVTGLLFDESSQVNILSKAHRWKPKLRRD